MFILKNYLINIIATILYEAPAHEDGRVTLYLDDVYVIYKLQS